MLLALASGVQAQDGGAGATTGNGAGTPVGAGIPAGASGAAGTAVIDLTRRVIGGNRARAGQFPSIVALLDAGLFSPASRQFCGGTVIDAYWVLTAAHCLHDRLGDRLDPTSIRIIEQVLDLRAETVGEEVMVVNTFVHPGYDHGSVETYDDIALLELATALDSPPATLFEQDPDVHVGSEATIAGWGATRLVPPQYPDDLQFATVPLVSREACNAPGSYDFIREGQLCAGFIEGGVDSCLGDSGGPLYTFVNERVELIGVTSFGRGCAEPNFYGIYTDVSAYLPWIDQYVVARTLTRAAGEPDSKPEPEPTPESGDGMGGNGDVGTGGEPPVQGQGPDPAEPPTVTYQGSGGGAVGWPLPVVLGAIGWWRLRVRRGARRAAQPFRNSLLT